MMQTVTSFAEAFSVDYQMARTRFRAAAEAKGFRLEAVAIGGRGPNGEELAIDCARLGAERPDRVVVVSSGLHGVEGFLGSAVQLAFLESATWDEPLPDGGAIVFLHALDPYGFAWVRRFDEDNVDLNRNFLINGSTYRGSPHNYRLLNGLLNPSFAPVWPDSFWPRALLALAWYGRRSVRQAVAHGQYDFPRGLFFGGHGRSRVHQRLLEHMPRWLGSAAEVIHLDFHTGLGEWGTYALLLSSETNPAQTARLREWFGVEHVKGADPSEVAYTTSGDLGPWCHALFPDCRYDYLCAEFGTYSGLQVLSALRAENQAHHWGSPDSAATQSAKERLREAFAPADPTWRESAVKHGIELVEKACAIELGLFSATDDRG